jgi:hypothetical protein
MYTAPLVLLNDVPVLRTINPLTPVEVPAFAVLIATDPLLDPDP